MSNVADNISKEYADILKRNIGTHLKNIVLFGLHARGDSDEGSDYDVLIIVDRRTNDIREAILDADVEMMNRYEKLFAALIYDESEWQNARSFPHAWNIEREGVVL